MISKPEANCPRCGKKLIVKDPIGVSKNAITVIYYAECSCGAADITVSKGQITDITLRDPLDIPEYYDEPAGTQEDPEYMAR